MGDQGLNARLKCSHDCGQILAEALEKCEYSSIEQGLSIVYDLFVEYVLEDQHSNLMSLGRDLNSAYLPHRNRATEPAVIISSYLGQIRALINLCDYFTQRILPEGLWEVVIRSKYTRPMMLAIQRRGAMLATELSTQAGLPHASQLHRTVQPLIDHGLLRRERFGKNVWYSLTSTGRLVTSTYFGMQDNSVLESVFPAVLSMLTRGWYRLDDLVDAIEVDLPDGALRPLITSIVSGLHRFRIAQEHGGSWTVAPELLTGTRRAADISEYPQLGGAVRLIKEVYDKLRRDGVPGKNSLEKARGILDGMSNEAIRDGTQPHGLQVRILLERAKCSALGGDWRTACALMGEAEVAAETHGLDAALFDEEGETIWSYIEAAYLEPQLDQISDAKCRDYRQARDVLLTILHVIDSSQRRNCGAILAKKLLCVALDMTRVFDEPQLEYEQMTTERSISEWQTSVYVQEQTKEVVSRWQPSSRIEHSVLSPG